MLRSPVSRCLSTLPTAAECSMGVVTLVEDLGYLIVGISSHVQASVHAYLPIVFNITVN
ncbi:MAG TPA: hypothetical protein VFG09_05050 [Thermodesulfovibrionales bacterium]|jgi:hypothetical protein|nr:hypothetical protein [Thermodesulfovibrionales bacterium]